jgi:hypothetical protein
LPVAPPLLDLDRQVEVDRPRLQDSQREDVACGNPSGEVVVTDPFPVEFDVRSFVARASMKIEPEMDAAKQAGCPGMRAR